MGPEEIAEAMKQVASAGASMQIVSVAIQSYATFANNALNMLMAVAAQAGELGPANYEYIAQEAWKLADKMMVEYSKRNLGKVP